ncbi:MAG: phage gp6-like head-tail connector protein, partial [Alphaproteobacteria bacterium]|nr:phage gp6-like head-tail connector protein [Alphaproteobacteria bacterium]
MQNNVTYKILSVEEREIWPLEEVKNYLRVPHKNDDKLIANLISSAVITA